MGASTTTLPLRAAPARAERSDRALLAERVSSHVKIAQLAAGLIGALDVFALLWWVLPAPPHAKADDGAIFLVNAIAFAVMLPIAGIAGVAIGRRVWAPVRAWLSEHRDPTERERAYALRHPLYCAGIDAVCWGVAAIVFTALNLPFGLTVAGHVGSTIAMGGVTCTALGYLFSERQLRPIVALALESGPPPPRCKGPGVKSRLILVWLAATGVPVAGLVMVACTILVDGGVSAQQAAVNMLALSGVSLVCGLGATYLVARSVADPLTSVRRAVSRIEAGDLGARVRVDDGSEVGLLQSGVNAMAAGLAERERLRDLFGRHVGEDVARAALRDDAVRLGGELRDVAVLFVDVVGSTTLAARRPPREVVALLNDFFAVVVDVVGRHGGWVNKFEGDAALIVFGAPAEHPDPAGAALRAARELCERLAPLPLDAGIGVSCGPAVAGNVGAEQRFEYTVIGDPVNEAARLCDLAKRHDERVLASERTLRASRDGDAGRWTRCDEIVLRGRTEPTQVLAPA